MDDDEMEKRLLEHGFTVKDCRFITYWVKKERSTYKTRLMELRRIFIGFVIMRSLVTAVLFISYFMQGNHGFYSFLFAYVFFIIACEFFSPFLFGLRVFANYKRLIK